MLDEFVWGKVGRISPEAPVPVVEVSGESFYPGGAANVARNLREFTAHVGVVGMIGRDRGGEQLRQLLADQKIDTSACSISADFPTIVKTRIIARQESDADDNVLKKVGATLLQKWQTELVLITLGEEGMMLFQRGQKPHHVPTKARQVFDVSGAGDTAIALFTLALCSGATPLEAAEIANHASAVVVGKLGTATVSPEELRKNFENG